MKLRPYQQEVKQRIYDAWSQGDANVCAVLPTGAGKTVLFSEIIHDHNGASCAIAHRSELVGQMSVALARQEVRHQIIGPNSLIKMIVQDHHRETGRSWFDPSARAAVAGVNTLVNRGEQLRHWMQQVTLWVQDECHHVLRNNIWGRAVDMFPHARGLGVTATPVRADGRGLGRHADGVMDRIIEGPSMRALIDDGYLTDYIIRCPPNDIHLENVPISDASGDFSPKPLKKAVRESHIVGDVVQHYVTHTPGKLGVVFATDVETASDIAKRFVQAGVRAECVSAETDDRVRSEIIRRFRKHEIDVLCNCDLFGEGFDLPAIEVGMFARPTQSYGLYCQQFGRALRPVYAPGYDLSTRAGRLASIAASAKPIAIIHDHVGNIHHGLPDAPRVWTLNSRDKRAKQTADDAIPLRPCVQCTRPYERFRIVCPYCGFKPEPAGRSYPAQVDGDLTLLDPQTLAAMRGAIITVDAPPVVYGSDIVGASIAKNHRLRQDAQTAMRSIVSWWAGVQRANGLNDREAHKKFFLQFGIDIMSAQTLGRSEAMELSDRINRYLGGNRT